MASSKHVGLIACPLCGSECATVHEQQTGTKKGRLYYRCYTERGGMQMRCGTIQCIGPDGQEFIKKHMRPIAPAVGPTPTPEPVKAEQRPIGQVAPVTKPKPPAPDPAPKPIDKPRRSLSSALFGSDWGGGDE